MKELLSLIESVDPSDTEKLDEIDARVWCAINNLSFCGMHETWSIYCYIDHAKTFEFVRGPLPTYTRSRDALKAIRPEGWTFDIYWHETTVEVLGAKMPVKCTSKIVKAELPKSEELTELHAIIQAISHERSQ